MMPRRSTGRRKWSERHAERGGDLDLEIREAKPPAGFSPRLMNLQPKRSGGQRLASGKLDSRPCRCR